MFKNFFNKQNIQSIFQKSFGSTGRGSQLTRAFELERAAYKKAKNEYIKKHQVDFWDEQTKVENERIEEFMKVQKEKKKRDDSKLRSSIIINSKKCYESMKDLIDRQQEFISKQKLWRQQDMEILMQKNDLLTMLDKQSKDWLTPQNIDEKLETELNNLLPPIIASHKDYYNRLIKFSFDIEQGKFEDAEDLKINKKIVEYKNKLLAPLFQELKTIIKYLVVTEESSVFELYKETINRIKSRFSTEKDRDLKNLMEKITYDFKKLITLIRLENEKPENKIIQIENQIKSLVMILVVWNRYTDIIYKPEDEIIQELDDYQNLTYNTKQRLQSTSLDDLIKENDPQKIKKFYLQRITEKKGKGQGLFINEFLGLYDNPDLRKKMDKLESEEKKKIDSKNFDDPKYDVSVNDNPTQVIREEGKKQSANAVSSKKQNEEIQENHEIKKARNVEINESINSSGPKGETSEMKSKKVGKKQRAAVESADMKLKKKKKASIEETKRKLLENEASEVFKDQDNDEEFSEENEDKDEKCLKSKMNQEELEKNRIQLEEFEKNNDQMEKPNENVINEKLRDYYESIKDEKLSTATVKSKRVENNQVEINKNKEFNEIKNEEAEEKEQFEQEIKTNKKKNFATEILERSFKKQIDLSEISMIDVKEKYDEYKKKIADEFDLNNKGEKEKMAQLEKELDNIDISKIININEFENELIKEKKRITLEKEFQQNKENIMQSEFFNTIIEYSKDIFNFKKPRITTNIDIYDEDLLKYFEVAIEESKINYQRESTSLIMEYLKKELEAVKDDELSSLNRIKKKHLIRIADICSQMRIKDSHNLCEIFQMNKMEKISFDV